MIIPKVENSKVINSSIVFNDSVLNLKEENQKLKLSTIENISEYSLETCIQTILEYNLDVISDNSAKSIYYVEPKVIGDYASNKSDIWRWLQILNEMYNILTGVFPKWQYLLCKDGFPTIDGRKILVRGDFIG